MRTLGITLVAVALALLFFCLLNHTGCAPMGYP